MAVNLLKLQFLLRRFYFISNFDTLFMCFLFDSALFRPSRYVILSMNIAVWLAYVDMYLWIRYSTTVIKP